MISGTSRLILAHTAALTSSWRTSNFSFLSLILASKVLFLSLSLVFFYLLNLCLFCLNLITFKCFVAAVMFKPAKASERRIRISWDIFCRICTKYLKHHFPFSSISESLLSVFVACLPDLWMVYWMIQLKSL